LALSELATANFNASDNPPGAEPVDVGVTAAHDLLDGKGGRALLEDVA